MEDNEKSLEWSKEQRRVDSIVDLIEEKKLLLEKSTGHLKEDIIELRKNFWDDVTVNIDEPDEVIETYASIKQQAELLSERERSHGQFHKTVKLYKRLKDSPYFGRIDFSEETNSKESVYLGIGSLMDREDEDFLIYDWRAPIASMYYDYSPGPAQYETPEGIIDGEMELKRQYLIKNGVINGMFDTGVTIGDELLQQVLGGNADNQMKSIVATIQKEQNQIIRYEKKNMLVVQGVAGSGKTSAAMQRIAYLLYRYRETIDADQILLFSPNQMFISYVASVLPELGEENMRQTTFHEYASHRLDEEYDLETSFEQLEGLLTAQIGYQERLSGITFKSSLDFKQIIDDYVRHLSREGMVFRNIRFRKKTIVKAAEIRDYFYSLSEDISIPNRMEKVMEWLLATIDKVEKQERKKDWPMEKAAYLDKKVYLDAYNKLEKEQRFNDETFDDYEREEKLLTKLVVKKSLKPLRQKIKKMNFIFMRKLYQQLVERIDAPDGISREMWHKVQKETEVRLKQLELRHEDITPYLYLQDQLEGRKANTVIRHVFIDEAQDYSPFQFALIKSLFPYARFTLLGDYNQAIHSHGSHTSVLTEETHFGKHVERMTLMRSYRSTRPIVEFTKWLIPDGERIEAFNREGRKPRIHYAADEHERMKTIESVISQRQMEGHQTIAVLGRSKKECHSLYEKLSESRSARFIHNESQNFEKGLLILPVYLAKGVEFDAVILPEASYETYDKEEERKLFYTACTRAMHELDIVYMNEKSRFLQGVPSEYYRE
ncbi:RNA polymerase recycling motor HelD [Thalassobacillus pellis]|uniref:RNA polymerase recycling motor HelD n=1 Tax=Thalassobacillus pellis TaxID=748008 RepID=UPI0019613B24|nr:DNA helicase-2/ATP-dependent DNA helicase PcrA [Thalassobacillus pellis]